MQRLMISHSLLDLIKAGGAVPGTRKKRADGHWYIKQANGEWVREKAQRGAKKEDKKEAPRAKAPEGVRGRSAYRALPNGRIVHVPQEFDERKKAARNPEKHKGKVVHADKESTSYVNAQGELKTHKHKPTDFLNEEAIHARLNSILTLDEEFAENYMRVKNGITDYRDFLNELVKAEKQHAKENDRKPEFTDIAGARKHFIKTEVRPALKAIQKEYGEVTTWAKLSQAWPEIMEDLQQEQTDVNPQMRIMAQLAQEHGEGAIEAAERQLEQVRKAKAAHPDDCPVIPSLSENITFFGHQAEALAMLNQLDKAIVDVDMGGGKGLLLPADAMNLMAQGKVKKPLIVVPGATLEQNGRKIHEYTDNGMNVFLIDNTVIREIYDGDMEALQKDIEDAPPNTIFMASYDVFSYKPKASDEIDEIEYPRAAALADAGFDMISLDECFAPDTLVETSQGQKRIADICVGDYVKNCIGYSKVTATKHKKLDRHVTLRINQQTVTCSANHPFMTPRGWVLASDLKKGDLLVQTDEAMRVVWERICDQVFDGGNEQEQILWNVLLREMAYEQFTEIGKLFDQGREDKQGQERQGSSGLLGENEEKQSHVQYDDQRKNETNAAQDWSQTDSSLSKKDYAIGIPLNELPWDGLEMGAWRREIQDRLGPYAAENSSGDRWSKSLQSNEAEQGSNERCPPGFSWVESVEIHEQGSSERNPEGLFYDLSVEGHPSFTVAGVLVRNSHNIKNINSGRFKALQHMSHIPIKRVASGTFLSNNPKDVLGQLLFLFPHAAMSEKNFMQKYGFEDSKGGTKWDMDKLKQLREDLQNIGMISLRRSAWMNKLPERKELPRIVKMDKKHAQVNEIIVNEVVDALEDELKKDPRIEKLLEGSDFDTDDDLPPNVLGPLNLLQAITDYPDELAKSLKQDIVTYREGKKKEAEDDLEMEESSTLEAIRRRVAQLTPAARKAILSLEGTVSPKALDAYKAMEEHFKDPKNGKFMVFVQRKMAANHVIDNMPEHLKKMAVYYDASKKDALESFVKDPNGPKIIVAVDQSIKEGVNMQVANAQYRYDHHYVPGNQEQGYARIWRFGQDKPAKIYLGLVDGGVDVTKYARLISKLHTNQMVVSNMEDDDTFTAFKLNLNNIRNNRSANQVLPEYFDMNKKMLDYQYGENKQLAKKYGTKTWKRSSPKKIGGKDAKEMHGRGAYLDDIDWKVDASLNNEEKDTLLQHYRERVSRKNKDMAFDRTVEADNFPLLKQIVEMHKSRKKKELHQKTIDDLREIAKDFYGDEYDEGNFNAMVEAADSYLKGKKVKGHKDHNPKDAVTAFFYMKNKPDFATDKELVNDVYYDVDQFRKWALKNKVKLKHIGGGVVEDNEATEKFWKDYEKQHGKFSQKHRDYVHGIASLIDETFGGYEAVKHHHEDEEDQ